MIWLIRHGQTEWNEKSMFRGHKDIPLSDKGKLDSELTAGWLKKQDIHIVYSSPLKRAFQTASIIASKCKSRIQVIKGLIDINFGKWEGKTFEWVRENDPENYHIYRNFPQKCRFPGGESLVDCYERAFCAFRTAASKSEKNGLNTAFITHRVILKLILIGSLGLSLSSFWKIQLNTCSMSMLELRDGEFIIRTINSTCHLAAQNQKGIDF